MLTIAAEVCDTDMRKSVSILLVDDHHGWRETVRSLLVEDARFQVVAEAVDGPEALQRVQELEPDLVLLDINLPGMSGIEVARHIRFLSLASKVIYLTENSYASVHDAAMAAGAAGYVTKSRALDDLLPTIEAALQ